MNARDKVVKARGQMLNVAPFWATISLMLQIEVNNALTKTMGTDGKRLVFNEQFVDALTMEELQGVCAHEAAHVVFEHIFRRNGRDAKRWNIAADYAINAIVREAFTLPNGALYSDAYEGMTAEEIYERIPEGPSEGEGSGGSGEGTDPGGCGEVWDYTGDEEGDEPGSEAAHARVESLRREVNIAIAQAAQIQKGHGALPAAIQKLVDSLKAPSLDWRELLRRFVTSSAKNDYTWRRPNRRLVADDIYIPSLHSDDNIGGIVVAIDTSGSCWNERIMEEFCSELNGIVGIVRGEVRILYADTEVQKEVVFSETDRPVKLEAIGGGGTDFCAVFEHVAKLPTTPQCLIYLTDLEGRFPTAAPSYPVLWGLVSYYGNASDHKAPFGDVVAIGESRHSRW